MSDPVGTAEHPFSGEGVGDVEKPWWDMTFLLVATSITIGCKRVFGLTTVWAHPHQACFETLRGGSPQACATGRHQCRLTICLCVAKWCCILCASNEWRAHQCYNGMCTQLQVCKLFQHKGKVVCPDGLDGELEALQFTFPELPLWDTAAPGEPFWELWHLEVDLSSAQPEGMTTAIQAPTTMLVLTYPPADTIEPHHDITMAINLHLQEGLEHLQWALPTALAPVSQHSMPRIEPQSVALGAPPLGNRTEDPLRLMGWHP